jgi:CheY-like chemotaxis protein
LPRSQHFCRGGTNIESRSILIVEDNDDLRDSLATLLAVDGTVVDQAHSVATAREALVKKPDIVLLDVHLDEEHSYELAAEVLAANVPPAVVVMSGAATDLDRQRFEALGISAYLSKPFFLDDLARVMVPPGSDALLASAQMRHGAETAHVQTLGRPRE